MKVEFRENLIKYIVDFLLIICVGLMALQFTQYNFMSAYSIRVPIILFGVLSIYHLFFNRNLLVSKKTIRVILITTIFFVYYIINVNSQYDLNVHYMLWLALIYLIFILIVSFKNNLFIFPVWSIFVFIFVNVTFLPRLIDELHFVNSQGIVAFLLMFFCVMTLKNSNYLMKIINLYTILILVLVIFETNSRTALLALIATFFVFVFWKLISKYVFAFSTLLITLSILIIIFYVKIKDTALGNKLHEISIEVTGKRLYNGRQVAWKDAINDTFNSNFIFGMGNNVQFELYGGYLHSLYVQLFYQSGLFGLAMMLLLLFTIMKLAKNAQSHIYDYQFRVLVSFFTGVLMLQIFEGHLIYSFSVISIMSWIIIALLTNRSLGSQYNR